MKVLSREPRDDIVCLSADRHAVGRASIRIRSSLGVKLYAQYAYAISIDVKGLDCGPYFVGGNVHEENYSIELSLLLDSGVLSRFLRLARPRPWQYLLQPRHIPLPREWQTLRTHPLSPFLFLRPLGSVQESLYRYKGPTSARGTLSSE